MSEPKPSRRSKILSSARSIGGAVFIALLFRAFVAEAYVIPSGSMEPSLLVGDRIVVFKSSFGLRVPLTDRWLLRWDAPRRGDVVVFEDPKGSGENLVKRVAAVAGDRVALRDNVVLVNGEEVARRALDEGCSMEDGTPCQRYLEESGEHRYRVQQIEDRVPYTSREITVPEGRCFVLGDNRDDSNDSRFWGFVPYERLRGRASFILWSWGEGGPRLGRSGQGLD